MIFSLRGTSGSGKSTAIKSLMSLSQSVEVIETVGNNNAPLVYSLRHKAIDRPIFVLGSYDYVHEGCGGCDRVRDAKTIVPALLQRYAAQGHVLFEGLLIGSTLGIVGIAMCDLRNVGHRVVFGILDTPLDVCIDRVKLRRMHRGDDREFNVGNTTRKYHQIKRMRLRLLDMDLPVVDLDHRCVVDQIIEILAKENMRG